MVYRARLERAALQASQDVTGETGIEDQKATRVTEAFPESLDLQGLKAHKESVEHLERTGLQGSLQSVGIL